AEHAAWMAAREPQGLAAEDAEGSIRSAQVQKFGSDAVLYRVHDENAPAHDPQPDAAPSGGYEGWEAWMAGHLRNERAKMSQVMTAALVEFGANLQDDIRQQFEAELIKRDREIGELNGQIRELKGLVGGLVTLLGQPKPKLWTPP